MGGKQILLGLTLCGAIVYLLTSSWAIVKYKKTDRQCSGGNVTQPKKDYVFQDKMFEPLLTIFKQKAAGELTLQNRTFRSGKVPKFLLWARPFWKHYWIPQTSHIRNNLCPLPCTVTFDEKERGSVDAIVIELRGTKDPQAAMGALGPRDPRQPWIMLSLESPPLASPQHRTDVRLYNRFFNRTMTYRRDADILLPHGFVVSKKDAELLPPSWVKPPVLEHKKKPRKLALVFISKHNDMVHSNRLAYVKKFKEYAPIDVYGKFGDMKCGKSMIVTQEYDSTKDECLKMAGENYLFIFSLENNFCKDYITEKVYNFLYYPIVPVVRGSADYSLYLPPNSYINAKEYTPKDLAKKLLFLQRNPKEYQKYFEWKQHYQPSTIGGERTFCHLCARLYDPDIYKHNIIEDFEDWFVYKSECWGPIYTEQLRRKKSKHSTRGTDKNRRG
ncbi:4-galactosyl-N-acetylglucosaminide 3-alpha-L-fucosyltransferase FUT6-like [Macrobrachium rosenbergii]|uniref:4-galactosyl-N-acetylglucosaminide 3-alpha-L-fucosyltransferase FUT6-like n=1 Tax=Macrobrachium rosenbergii TaxID=79674 RepID=UPI0034D70CDA